MKWNDKGHEFDEIGKKLAQRKEIIIYGVTQSSIEIYKRLLFFKANVTFSDEKLKGNILAKKEICSLYDAVERLRKGNSILIVSADNGDKLQLLRRKLLTDGFVENEDFFEARVFREVYLPVYGYYAFGKCYVDYLNHIPNYACTLKCKVCSACIPYLKEKNPSVEQLKREIDLFFEKVDFLYTYDCTGGETFLASEKIAEVLEYLIQNYGNRVVEIQMVSNATVLPSEKMIEFLKKYKNRVKVIVSRYDTVDGWQMKFLKFKQMFDENEIPFTDVPLGRWIDFGWLSGKSLGKTKEELQTYFDFCGTYCRAYINGKIYYCVHGHFGNKICNPNTDDTEEAIDFNDDSVTKTVIIEFCLGYQEKGYLQICNHCNGWGVENQNFIPVAEQLTR